MTFNQNNWQVGTVYQVSGDLHLTSNSSHEDFLHVLRELRNRAGDLPAEVDQELDEAAAERAENGTVTQGRLARIAERLRAMSGASTAALELARSVDTAAQWAGHHL